DERYGGDFAPVLAPAVNAPFHGAEIRAAFRVPQLENIVGAATDKHSAVGLPTDAKNMGRVTGQDSQAISGGRIEDLDEAVGRCCREPLAVGREADAEDGVGMGVADGGKESAVGDVPDLEFAC